MSPKVEISKRLVLINSASSLLTRVINVSVLVWLQQYLLRRISPEEYSIYPVVMAVMIFVPLFSTILTSGLGRFVVEAYAKGDEKGVTQIVSTMFPLLLGAGILLLAAGLTFSWYVGDILTIAPGRVSDARIMMSMLMLAAAVRMPLAPFTVGFFVQQKFVLLNIIRLGAECLRIAILFILLFGVSTRILWVVIAVVSADLCTMFVMVGVSRRMIPALKFRAGQIRWSLARKLSAFGTWNLFGQISHMIRTAAAPLILNKLATPVDVNCFYLGSLPHRQFRKSILITSAPLQPALIAMHAAGSKKRLENAYLRGGRYGLWIALLVAIPLMIYRHEVLSLYLGHRYSTYAEAAKVMLLMFLTYPLLYPIIMLSKIAHATGQLRAVTTRILLLDLISIGLMFYFVAGLHWGAAGAAMATLSVYLIGCPLLLWPLGIRMVNTLWSKYIRQTLVRGLLPGLIAGGAWWAIQMAVSPAGWLSLGGCFAGGLICYILVIFLFCLDSYDREQLNRLFGSLLRKVGILGRS